jgi:hypothetical protein
MSPVKPTGPAKPAAPNKTKTKPPILPLPPKPINPAYVSGGPPIKEKEIAQKYLGEGGKNKLIVDWQVGASIEACANKIHEDLVNNKRLISIWKNKVATMESLKGSVNILYRSDFRKKYKSILIKYVNRAFQLSEDLNIAEWKSHLINIINKERDIIVIEPIYSSEQSPDGQVTTSCNVIIDLDMYMGTITDYQRAIRYARKVVGYGDKLKGIRGSRAWFERLWMSGRRTSNSFLNRGIKRSGLKKAADVQVKEDMLMPIVKRTGFMSKRTLTYDPLLGTRPQAFSNKQFQRVSVERQRQSNLHDFYWDIMIARMSDMGAKAPYWYILNYGSIILPGDQGGTAMPAVKPTWFLDTSISEIGAVAYQDLTNAVQTNNIRSQREIEKYESNTSKIEEAWKAINEIADQYKGENEMYRRALQLSIKRMESQWAPVFAAIQENSILTQKLKTKIEEMSILIIAGLDIADVTYPSRISVFYKGGDYRRRTRSLVASIKAEILKELNIKKFTEPMMVKAKIEIKKAGEITQRK